MSIWFIIFFLIGFEIGGKVQKKILEGEILIKNNVIESQKQIILDLQKNNKTWKL